MSPSLFGGGAGITLVDGDAGIVEATVAGVTVPLIGGANGAPAAVNLTAGQLTGLMALSQLPPGSPFYVTWNVGASDWYYNGASCGGVRPSARGDLIMIATGGPTNGPAFSLTTDFWFSSLFTAAQALKPAAWLYETYARANPGNNTGITLPTSGAENLSAIYLPQGLTIGHLHFATSPTNAAGAPTHWWMSLFDNNMNQLATTADQGAASLAATDTDFAEAIAQIASGASATFVTTYNGDYFIGLNVTSANTMPNILATVNEANFLPPVLAGKGDTGLTTPPAFPHAGTALPAGGTTQWYFGVS